MKKIYDRPSVDILKIVVKANLLEHSGELGDDDYEGKGNMSWDDSEAPIFEAHHNKLWDE